MNVFSVVPELRIGSITEVSGTSIRVELDGSITELTRTYGGRVYPIGQFASVIKIHYGRRILVAYVRLLRMRSELAREAGFPIPPPSEDSRIIDADLLGRGCGISRIMSLSLIVVFVIILFPGNLSTLLLRMNYDKSIWVPNRDVMKVRLL